MIVVNLVYLRSLSPESWPVLYYGADGGGTSACDCCGTAHGDVPDERSELKMSASTFQFPSGCFFHIATYLP